MWRALAVWFFGLDGSVLSGIAIWVALHPALSEDKSQLMFHSLRQRRAYAACFALMMMLATASFIWDTDHPGIQFPYGVRWVFWAPIVALANYALLTRARDLWTHRRPEGMPEGT